MTADPLDTAVHLTSLVGRSGSTAARNASRRFGIVMIEAAWGAADQADRDAAVAGVVEDLDGYAYLAAVTEAARATVHCLTCVGRRSGYGDASLELGVAWIVAVLAGNTEAVRALAPSHRRADVRNDEAALLASAVFHALERVADEVLVIRALLREEREDRSAERSELEALMAMPSIDDDDDRSNESDR